MFKKFGLYDYIVSKASCSYVKITKQKKVKIVSKVMLLELIIDLGYNRNKENAQLQISFKF